MKKKKTKFDSLSTPGLKQDCPQYLVELVFLRKNYGRPLPPKFWQLQKYKWNYGREIQACRKFIKKYGEYIVLKLAIDNALDTWRDFARVEFLAQQLLERVKAKRAPKDTSSVLLGSNKVDGDVRDYELPQKRKGLFERLKELNDG